MTERAENNCMLAKRKSHCCLQLYNWKFEKRCGNHLLSGAYGVRSDRHKLLNGKSQLGIEKKSTVKMITPLNVLPRKAVSTPLEISQVNWARP